MKRAGSFEAWLTVIRTMSLLWSVVQGDSMTSDFLLAVLSVLLQSIIAPSLLLQRGNFVLFDRMRQYGVMRSMSSLLLVLRLKLN